MLSSHCVLHSPARKSGCAIMARNISRLVFTPEICVSLSALCAFLTVSFQDAAVMMSFANRLSKSEDTTNGCPLIRCVSTRIPLPVGNWNDVILPMESDQSLCTFSDVIRS